MYRTNGDGFEGGISWKEEFFLRSCFLFVFLKVALYFSQDHIFIIYVLNLIALRYLEKFVFWGNFYNYTHAQSDVAHYLNREMRWIKEPTVILFQKSRSVDVVDSMMRFVRYALLYEGLILVFDATLCLKYCSKGVIVNTKSRNWIRIANRQRDDW